MITTGSLRHLLPRPLEKYIIKNFLRVKFLEELEFGTQVYQGNSNLINVFYKLFNLIGINNQYMIILKNIFEKDM